MSYSCSIGLLGARSMIGECVMSLLVTEGRDVIAFSRRPAQNQSEARINWVQLDEHSGPNSDQVAKSIISDWLCLAPIWVLPQHFSLLESYGVRRLVALSSTSRFTKVDSSDPRERAIALRLAEAESRVKAWATIQGVEWTILRPTLIYGMGRDKNITEIARFIRRFGFFPLFGKANGLRQPLHAHDVGSACVAALDSPNAANHSYNLSGSETVFYRDMVARIFVTLGRPLRLLPVPLVAFQFVVTILRIMPRYRSLSFAIAQRMNCDLVFDHSDATRDFGFAPREFVLGTDDVSVQTKKH